MKRDVGIDQGETFRIELLRSVDELREIALSASPPSERKKNEPDLVELERLLQIYGNQELLSMQKEVMGRRLVMELVVLEH